MYVGVCSVSVFDARQNVSAQGRFPQHCGLYCCTIQYHFTREHYSVSRVNHRAHVPTPQNGMQHVRLPIDYSIAHISCNNLHEDMDNKDLIHEVRNEHDTTAEHTMTCQAMLSHSTSQLSTLSNISYNNLSKFPCSLPPCLPTYLPTCMPACIPACLPDCLTA